MRYIPLQAKLCENEVSYANVIHHQWQSDDRKVSLLFFCTNTKLVELTPIVTHFRLQNLRDENCEMPKDFDNEIHKWALECIGRVALDVRLGCLDPNLSADSEAQNIIECARYALRNIAILELKAPFWRYIPSSLWTRYVKNMDFFIE